MAGSSRRPRSRAAAAPAGRLGPSGRARGQRAPTRGRRPLARATSASGPLVAGSPLHPGPGESTPTSWPSGSAQTRAEAARSAGPAAIAIQAWSSVATGRAPANGMRPRPRPPVVASFGKTMRFSAGGRPHRRGRGTRAPRSHLPRAGPSPHEPPSSPGRMVPTRGGECPSTGACSHGRTPRLQRLKASPAASQRTRAARTDGRRSLQSEWTGSSVAPGHLLGQLEGVHVDRAS